MRLIVADDSEDALKFVELAFESIPDRQVVLASGALEAWWHLTKADESFDVALIDVNMPGVSGLDLLERMRSEPRLANVPVILCTAAADRSTITRAAAYKPDGYLVKPFAAQALQRKVQDLEARKFSKR